MPTRRTVKDEYAVEPLGWRVVKRAHLFV